MHDVYVSLFLLVSLFIYMEMTAYACRDMRFKIPGKTLSKLTGLRRALLGLLTCCGLRALCCLRSLLWGSLLAASPRGFEELAVGFQRATSRALCRALEGLI